MMPQTVESASPIALLDGLNVAARVLIRIGAKPPALREMLKDEIARVERVLQRKVAQRDGATDNVWFVLESKRRSSDYARTVKPNEVRILTAKIGGVVMSANFYKPNAYNHENVDVSQALRALAGAIERQSYRLADHDVEIPLG